MTVQAGGLAVIWIDWYPYHVARFRALTENAELAGRSFGIEMVGGVGVHAGLVFRDPGLRDLPILTLEPTRSWHEAGQFGIACKLWRALSKIQPGAVLIPGYYTLPGIAAALWCRLYRKMPVLMTESAEQDHARLPLKEIAKGLIVRLLFQRAIAGGTAHIRYLIKLGMKASQVGKFYDTVDNRFFHASALKLRCETNAAAENLPDKYFLFVGRLAPEKNVGSLIAAFRDYRAQGGNWDLVIAGDGPLRSTLRKQASHSGCSSAIHFLGHRSAADLAVPYAFASCFVLPSYREPWGLVVNEAMAAQLPVLVSSAAGCAPDLVQSGGNGWVFDPFDIGLLCRLLIRVSSLEHRTWSQMGQRSGEIVSQYSVENWASEVARLTASQLQPAPYRAAQQAMEVS